MLLCNNITTADPEFIENNYELFYDDCEACEGQGEKDGVKCEECYGEGRHESEPYQYFLTSLSDYDKEQFDSYKIPHGYSELLDLDIIPIYDYGTSWSHFSYSKEVEDDYQLAYNETLIRSTVY
jgi:hypothetical protein